MATSVGFLKESHNRDSESVSIAQCFKSWPVLVDWCWLGLIRTYGDDVKLFFKIESQKIKKKNQFKSKLPSILNYSNHCAFVGLDYILQVTFCRIMPQDLMPQTQKLTQGIHFNNSFICYNTRSENHIKETFLLVLLQDVVSGCCKWCYWVVL